MAAQVRLVVTDQNTISLTAYAADTAEEKQTDLILNRIREILPALNQDLKANGGK